MNELMDSLTPMFAIVLSIGGPLAIAALVIQASHRKDMALQEMVASAAASGKSPEEIRALVEIVNPKSRPRRWNSLKAGILLLGTAAAMGFLSLVLDYSMVAPAAFLFFIGAAFVVVWRLTERAGNGS